MRWRATEWGPQKVHNQQGMKELFCPQNAAAIGRRKLNSKCEVFFLTHSTSLLYVFHLWTWADKFWILHLKVMRWRWARLHIAFNDLLLTRRLTCTSGRKEGHSVKWHQIECDAVKCYQISWDMLGNCVTGFGSQNVATSVISTSALILRVQNLTFHNMYHVLEAFMPI